jgi:hypothetical protein
LNMYGSTIDLSLRTVNNESAEDLAKRLNNQSIVDLIQQEYRKRENRKL